ncbi:MAG: L-aspartate oxidase [Actinomycetales bacterium]|nr:L-aspartate oxidase [Actinomycetales bacterium]
MKVIVVGSGIAGLYTAVKAAAQHEVTLITKDVLGESNTHYAQGGIAAVTATDDSVAEHVADTIYAGAGLCWEPAVQALCEQGPHSLNELIRFGVEFDRAEQAAKGSEFALGLEAAHSHARILHVGGDATGAGISNALVQTLKRSKARVLEHTLVTDLVVDSNRVVGVSVFSSEGLETLEADIVVLASGGAGQLYRHTTNPAVTTGDGVALALRAGAVLADLEFYQFHPTALAVPGSFLISEAVRGEGAVLINNRGERFMQKLHPMAELAPRDVVARAIQREMLSQGGEPVMLDATGLGADFLSQRFPGISAACRSYGLNLAKQPIPVTPAAHYWMGGIATDVFGRSSIPGLFAVGEVACNGSHGANRLASNSLLESLVFADRASSVLDQPWPADFGFARFNDQPPMRELEVDLGYPSDAPVVDRVELQTQMWDNVGLARDDMGLRTARNAFRAWRPQKRSLRLFTDYEDANLLDLAKVVTAAALARTESRGAHFRLDHTETNPNFARPITVRKA